MSEPFTVPQRGKKDSYADFAYDIKALSDRIGFKLSARGWCYQLETRNIITKAQFDKVENWINTCRKNGLLPVDFTAEEEGRQFSGIETPTSDEPADMIARYLRYAMRCESTHTPDWWDGEEYYIQMLVEKIDLTTLFKPVVEDYHIPIATSKGWSSILQRAEFADRFKDAEDRGLKSVLLYCGDHDPDGLRISETIHKNLEDIMDIHWETGKDGYDPHKLVIDRFGLNYDYIEANHLTWIDNLITGSKKDLADPTHPNHKLPYVQDYIAKYGKRKCEANALVVIPNKARKLCEEAITKYVGTDAKQRFAAKVKVIYDEYAKIRADTGLNAAINKVLDLLK